MFYFYDDESERTMRAMFKVEEKIMSGSGEKIVYRIIIMCTAAALRTRATASTSIFYAVLIGGGKCEDCDTLNVSP